MRPTKLCPGCGEVKKMTAHHIYPRRHFGRGPRNNFIFLLCWECHAELESYIPYRQMERAFYPAIMKRFIEELCPLRRKVMQYETYPGTPQSGPVQLQETQEATPACGERQLELPLKACGCRKCQCDAQERVRRFK